MKVKELKELLQNVIYNLEDYDDESEVKMVSNTYFLQGCRTFLGISGYDGGYINIQDIEVEEDYDEEEDY